jgi:hypothetical protein
MEILIVFLLLVVKIILKMQERLVRKYKNMLMNSMMSIFKKSIVELMLWNYNLKNYLRFF